MFSGLNHLPRWSKLVAASAMFSVLGVGYMRYVEPFWLDVTRHSVEIPGLPDDLDGTLVAHLSDLHVMRDTGFRSAVSQAIQRTQEAKPDLVLLTGDFAGERRGIERLSELVSQLRPLPTYGVFGNHEYQHGPSHRRRVTRALECAGVTLLHNRSVAVERPGGRLWLVGVDDAYTGFDELERALADLGESDRPRILLSHYPDLIHHPRARSVDLVLSGHTHGAQINIPFLNGSTLAHADSFFLSGWFRVNGVPLYVSRGLGTSGHRLRFRARPELAFFTLRQPSN